jgi:aminopeptidase C
MCFSELMVRSMLDLADEDEDSRIISFMNQSPVGDGGQWDMAVNLIGKLYSDEIQADWQRNTVSSPTRFTPTRTRQWHQQGSAKSSLPSFANTR